MDPDSDPTAAFEPLRPLPGLDQILAGTSARVIHDQEQASDHAGKPVPPMSPDGAPLRWKVRLEDSSIFATTADEVLSCFISDYDPTSPDTAAEEVDLEQRRRRQRVEHLHGIIINHVASAIMRNSIDPAAANVMQRAASWTLRQGPLQEGECPTWDHLVPLLLFADAYDLHAVPPRTPPAGNVQLVRSYTATEYLVDLAATGMLHLEQNPAWLVPPMAIITERGGSDE